MPNQYNYRSDVTTRTDPRYIASRIISVTDTGVLDDYLPASFGFETFDALEIHFYTIPDNILVLSTSLDVENAADVLKSHVVSYDDGSFRNYIRIDFTKLFEINDLIVIPGDYRMVINFFSDEVGTYTNRNLYISEISDSRTELQLNFFPQTDPEVAAQYQDDLREFVEPSFDRVTAIGVAEKIFASGVRLDDPDEGITYENILPYIIDDESLRRIESLGPSVAEKFREDVEQFFTILYETIREEIVIISDRRLQENEYKELIVQVIQRRIPELRALVGNRIYVE